MSNYAVLARKYRSQTFSDLIGQDVLVKTLTTDIITNLIAHAYILTGIRGTGKTSTARILAKALNCTATDKPNANPCGVCDNCKSIAAGQNIDVIEIDAASHTGVDDVRGNILDAVQYRPTNGRFKVYIIDEVHMLSTSAFNALLKTLEEPPSYVVFILATTEIHKVPITILSRCQRFDLARVQVEVLKKHFLEIAQKEQVELSDIAADLIARAADGSVRDGLSILDQAIAQTGGNITDESVMNMLRRADRQMITDFMKIILSGDTTAALKKSDEVYNAGSDVSLVLNDMMEWTHWATRFKIAPMSVENAPYTPDQKERMQDIAQNTTLNTLSRIWQVMVASASELKSANNPKQNFDMFVIRVINISDLPPISQLLEKTSMPMAATKTETPTAPKISNINDVSNSLKSDKEIVILAEWNNNVSIVEFEVGQIKMNYKGHDNHFISKLTNYLKGKTGNIWTIEIFETENKPTISEVKTEELKNDPLIADALNIFGGASVVSIK